MSIRDCFRLQRIEHRSVLNLTAFGRARLDTGNLGPAGLDAPDRYIMMYWVRLPIFGDFYDICTDSMKWGQRVLILHGKDGFVWRWVPVRNYGAIA